MEAYVLGNISATWKAAGGAFSVTGYVRNISDERYKSAGLVNDPLTPRHHRHRAVQLRRTATNRSDAESELLKRVE